MISTIIAVFACIGFIVGLVTGLVGFEKVITPTQLLSAEYRCKTNEGVKKILIGNNITVICNNSATFKLQVP